LDSPQNSEVPIEVPVSHKSPVRLWKPVEGEGVNLENRIAQPQVVQDGVRQNKKEL